MIPCVLGFAAADSHKSSWLYEVPASNAYPETPDFLNHVIEEDRSPILVPYRSDCAYPSTHSCSSIVGFGGAARIPGAQTYLALSEVLPGQVWSVNTLDEM